MKVNATAVGARLARSRSTAEMDDSMTCIALPFVVDRGLKTCGKSRPHGITADDAVMAGAGLSFAQLCGGCGGDQNGITERHYVVRGIVHDAQLNRARNAQRPDIPVRHRNSVAPLKFAVDQGCDAVGQVSLSSPPVEDERQRACRRD